MGCYEAWRRESGVDLQVSPAVRAGAVFHRTLTPNQVLSLSHSPTQSQKDSSPSPLLQDPTNTRSSSPPPQLPRGLCGRMILPPPLHPHLSPGETVGGHRLGRR